MRGAWVEIIAKYAMPQYVDVSLPVRGAWVEIESVILNEVGQILSLPVRGAWVEIVTLLCVCDKCRRSPCGERGLK